MGRHSTKTMKVLLFIFAGWFIGIPIYGGYALLNDADFLATLPQVENPDLDGFSIVLKKQLFLIVPTLMPVFFASIHLAFRLFPETFSLAGINPILRC
jgi:hypothetical protein